ncbi:MAG: nucleotidyltransferase family protein, partial [Paracoccaceae bacterium]
GRDKLLEPVAGHPLLRHQTKLALTQTPNVIVTLRDPDPARRSALASLPITVLHVADAATGMSASIRAAAAITQTALMILPADMPDLTSDDLAQLIAAFDQTSDDILRGSALGKPGHPVILPASLLPELCRLQGDEGARSVLQRHAAKVRLIALPDQHALTDLDTPEDWARWRQAASNTRAS